MKAWMRSSRTSARAMQASVRSRGDTSRFSRRAAAWVRLKSASSFASTCGSPPCIWQDFQLTESRLSDWSKPRRNYAALVRRQVRRLFAAVEITVDRVVFGDDADVKACLGELD